MKSNSEDSFEIPRLQYFLFIIDIFPVTPGHILIVPKRHVAEYMQLTDQERYELVDAIRKLYEHFETLNLVDLYTNLISIYGKKIPKSLSYLTDAKNKAKKYNRAPDGFNHGLNDCYEAGRTVNHLHYHIMPRWIGDYKNTTGGVRKMFTGKGDYKK